MGSSRAVWGVWGLQGLFGDCIRPVGAVYAGLSLSECVKAVWGLWSDLVGVVWVPVGLCWLCWGCDECLRPVWGLVGGSLGRCEGFVRAL